MTSNNRSGGIGEALRPSEELRSSVREALASALQADAERSGISAARRLIASGGAGAVGAAGALVALTGHPFGHHPAGHLVGFSCLWAAAFVVVFALCWLRIRTPRWPLADAARTALIALGLAGLAALLSPDPHVLHAWSSGPVGGWLGQQAGLFASAGGLGLASSFALASLAACISFRKLGRLDARLVGLSAAVVVLMLLPGITLHCAGETFAAWLGWTAGTLLGSGAGISSVCVLRRAWARPEESSA